MRSFTFSVPTFQPEVNNLRASGLRIDARFVAGEPISAGDVVFFTEFPDNTLVARVVTPDRLPDIEGPLYVAVSRDSHFELTFREVSRDDIE